MEKKLKEEVRVENYIFTSYKKGEKEEFGVFTVDNTLLHPDITDKNLLNHEKYNLFNDPFCYNGTHKGQYVLGLMFHSIEEMYKVYIELKKLGYKKVKVIEEYKDSEVREILYNLNDLKKCESLTFVRCGCILTVQIKAQDLYKFKKDLQTMREKLGYRCMWGSENLFDGYKCKLTQPTFIID